MATLVQLIDGEFVLSDAEAWRHETEARQILNMPLLGSRQAFLRGIEDKRGKEVADKLKATMLKLHEARKV